MGARGTKAPNFRGYWPLLLEGAPAGGRLNPPPTGQASALVGSRTGRLNGPWRLYYGTP